MGRLTLLFVNAAKPTQLNIAPQNFSRPNLFLLQAWALNILTITPQLICQAAQFFN